MNHLEFAALERSALAPSQWESWAGSVEELLQHGLDGSQLDDGYILDFAYLAWRAGDSAVDHAHRIKSDPYYRARQGIASTQEIRA